MSSDLAIEVNQLSKVYTIYQTPADRLRHAIRRRIRPQSGNSWREFWALKDVSFNVSKGESVGVVGRNGAGKSTLLQLICGTLDATGGSVECRGTIAALLELGSGFNPEFTGLENVYLYALVLGLSREQVDQQIEAILAFADIGDFIHRPLKTYSSGMVVRLAFAVSVCRKPDILIVDEALAVGDEAFKRKCFARIEELTSQGTTLLFVSHSANLVAELCDRVVVLEGGKLVFSGNPTQGLSWYTKLLFTPHEQRSSVLQGMSAANDSTQSLAQNPDQGDLVDRDDVTAFFSAGLRSESAVEFTPVGAKIENLRIETPSGKQVNVLVEGDPYFYKYDVSFPAGAKTVGFGMMVRSVVGTEIGGAVYPGWESYIPEIGANSTYTASFSFRCLLNPGTYFMNAGVQGRTRDSSDFTYLHRILDGLMFKVLAKGPQVTTGLVNLDISAQATLKE